MLRRTITRFALVALGLTLTIPSAHAQSEETKHTVGGFVGFQLFDLGDSFADAGVDIDEQIAFGGRYEYRLKPNWGVGGDVSFSPAEALLVTGDEVDVDTWYVNGTVTYHFVQTGPVHPFATGGGGLVVLDIDGGETEYFPSANFGGGIMAPITERISVRGDARGLLYFVDDLDPATAAVLGGDLDETIFDLQLSGGVSFNF